MTIRTNASTLTTAQHMALDVLRDAHNRRGFYGVDLTTLAEALDTSPEGAARTASSLVRRGLARRFRGGVGRVRMHYCAINIEEPAP